jgi:RHS repeat-associated protein
VTATAAVTSTVTQNGVTTYNWRGQSVTRDAYGEVTAVTDGRGLTIGATTANTTMPAITPNSLANWYTSHSVYDAQGDLTASATAPITTTFAGVTSTGPVTTTYTYDADGNQTGVTTPNGETTNIIYDHLGRPTTATQPLVPLYNRTLKSPTSSIAYDGDGNIVQRTDGAGDVTSASYDPLGRQTGATNALGATTILTYTATTLATVRDPLGHVAATYAYDTAGRLTGVTDPLNDKVSTGYDAASNVTGGSIGNGSTTVQTTTNTFDPLNEPASTTVGGPGTTSQTTTYQYDLDGNRAQATYADGAQATFSRDLSSLPTAATSSAVNATESFGYDPAANLQNSSDFNSTPAQDTVDGANRLTQWVAGTGALSDTVTYDPDGHALTQSETANGQTVTASAGYNAAGWQTSTTDNGLATSYGYDAAGRLRTTTLGSGGTLSATPDAAGRVTTLAEGNNQTTYSYNGDDQPTQVQLPGGVTETNGYDAAGRLASRTITGGGMNSSYSYTYNPAGWLTSIVSSVGGTGPITTTFTHDAFGHLTGASGGTTGTWTYHQDDSLATSGGTTYNDYQGIPLQTYSGTFCGVPCTKYYANGTAIGKTDAFLGSSQNVETHYTYDAAERLTGVYHCPANDSAFCAQYATGTASMSYNARGQRASYSTSGDWGSISQQFQYRGGQLAQVATVSGTTAYTDTYVYGPGGAPLELIRRTAAAGQCGATTCRYWYELDGQGNVVALTDSAGKVVDSYQYDPWGAPTSVSEQVPQRLRFRGYWYDQELGTYWLSVRQYDPALKQFLQADPSQQEGLSAYAYAKSDPVDLADPSGNDACNPGTGTGGYACQCPSGMQVVNNNLCGCPYNEAEYNGQCSPTWSSTLLVNPDGSCWPDPSNCLVDALSQAAYTFLYTVEYTQDPPKDRYDLVNSLCGSAALLAKQFKPGFVGFGAELEAADGIIWGVIYDIAWININTLRHGVIENPLTITLPFLGKLQLPVPNAGPSWTTFAFANTGPGEIVAAFYFTALVEEGSDPGTVDLCRNWSYDDPPNVKITVT